MIKWKNLLISILSATLISLGVSLLVAMLNFIQMLRNSDLFANILIVISIIISPIIGTFLGLKYYLSKAQPKYILIFGLIYFIIVYIFCVMFSIVGIFLIFPVGATLS